MTGRPHASLVARKKQKGVGSRTTEEPGSPSMRVLGSSQSGIGKGGQIRKSEDKAPERLQFFWGD